VTVQIACAEVERSEIRRTTFGVACKVEISLVPVVGCYGPICQSSGFGGVPACARGRSTADGRGCMGGWPSGPHDKRARGNAGEARQGTVAQGPTGTARGGRSEEARATGTAQRGTAYTGPLYTVDTSVLRVSHHMRPASREPWAWPVNVAFSRPDNHQTRSRRICTADVPGTPA
jgi:hypothetical protein